MKQKANCKELLATECAVRCAMQFADEVANTIRDTEPICSLLDAMEFFHSLSSNTQFYAFLRLVCEVIDIEAPNEMEQYSGDDMLCDLCYSCFMSEVITKMMNRLGGEQN